MTSEVASSSCLWSSEGDLSFEQLVEGDFSVEKLVEGDFLVEKLVKDDTMAIESRMSIHGGNSSQECPKGKRRRGIPWTEEEHRLFLDGLEKYGKGDWRGISRDFVKTRIPAQVASHAQKYFIRLNSKNNDKSYSMEKGKRRRSIHDILPFRAGDLAAAQGPIKSTMQSYQPPTAPPGIGVYGTAATVGAGDLLAVPGLVTDQTNWPAVTFGNSVMQYSPPPTTPSGVRNEIFSTFDVGTPTSLLVPDASHLAYRFPAPVTGLVVPDAPIALLEDYWCFCSDSCIMFCS